MSKIISTKKSSAISLAIVLMAGTIALFPTFFMVGTAQATSDHEKDYDKYDRKLSYEQDRHDDDRKSYVKDNFKPTEYQSYEQDRHDDDRKSYVKDNYKPTEYQSYEQYNYKPTEYSSYEKDNSYKSKDSSTIVKKFKCNNINVNLNGFNGIEVGTLPTALNGLATDEAQASEDEGEIGASSFGSGSGSDGKWSGHGSDSWCINNNDFAVVVGEEPVPPVPQTCVECYEEFLTQEQIDLLFPVSSIEEACDDSVGVITNEVLFRQIVGAAETITGEDIDIEALIDCLERAGLVFGENPPT